MILNTRIAKCEDLAIDAMSNASSEHGRVLCSDGSRNQANLHCNGESRFDFRVLILYPQPSDAKLAVSRPSITVPFSLSPSVKTF